MHQVGLERRIEAQKRRDAEELLPRTRRAPSQRNLMVPQSPSLDDRRPRAGRRGDVNFVTTRERADAEGQPVRDEEIRVIYDEENPRHGNGLQPPVARGYRKRRWTRAAAVG